MVNEIYPNQFYTFFMFPLSFKQEFSLNELISIMTNENGQWVHFDYELKSGKEYNEFLFFYPYIRNILFSNQKTSADKLSSAFFRFKLQKDKPNQYRVVNDINEKNIVDISLPLIDIYLHLFENGTGILAFEIFQEKAKYSLNDYLKFLDLGRRIYPSFINSIAEINDDNSVENAFSNEGKDAISAKQCASKIMIENGDLNIETNFITDFKVNKCDVQNIYLSNIIRQLLDSTQFSHKNKDYWPIVDDRMYTHSYYDISENEYYKANTKFIKDLKKQFKNELDKPEVSTSAKIWYQMIFIDSDSPACANDQMINKLIDESTYQRWSDFGGLYGFSRYSSAFISNYSAVPYVRDYFATMYYQIALLLFFYRGSLLSFSERIIQISKIIKEKNAIAKLQKLHEDFLLFENKYWFKEVTAQDQGIELFDLWESKMRNHALLNDVKQGIQELYTYFDSQREKKTSRKLTILTILGGILLPLTIAIEIMSIGDKLEFGIFNKWIVWEKIDLLNVGWFVFIGFTAITLFCIFKDSILARIKKSLKSIFRK